MSWKVEVRAGNDTLWTGNLLRFATREEAEANVQDLARLWPMLREWRTSESDDPVTHAYVNGKTITLTAYGILALAFADGTLCPHREQWLKSFDFEHENGIGYGEFTTRPERAMRFMTRASAMEFWRTTSKIRPKRDDGKPNRPLTALTVEIKLLP